MTKLYISNIWRFNTQIRINERFFIARFCIYKLANSQPKNCLCYHVTMASYLQTTELRSQKKGHLRRIDEANRLSFDVQDFSDKNASERSASQQSRVSNKNTRGRFVIKIPKMYQEEEKSEWKSERKSSLHSHEQDQLTFEEPEIPVAPKRYCKPMIPATFYDTVSFDIKCKEMKNLITVGTREDMIQWIQRNNAENFGVETNCQLLSLIESDAFWRTVVREMLIHVIDHSDSIGMGNLPFISRPLDQKQGIRREFSVNKMKCYVLLCQMFFGLIPVQLDHSVCSFAKYMHMGSLEKGPTEAEKENLSRLKALVHYFFVLYDSENHEFFRGQNLTFGVQEFSINDKELYDSGEEKQNETWVEKFEMEDDYGPLGDESLCAVEVVNKFNSGEHPLTICSVQEPTQWDDPMLGQTDYKLLQVFLFSHPEAFVAKLVFSYKLRNTETVVLSNATKFSHCGYDELERFACRGREEDLLNQTSPQRIPQRLVFVKQSRTFAQSAKEQQLGSFGFKKIKKQVEKYCGQLKSAVAGGVQNTEIKLYLSAESLNKCFANFLVKWCASSLVKTRKCKFSFHIDQNLEIEGMPGKQISFHVEKIRQHLQGKEVSDVFSLLKGYGTFRAECKGEPPLSLLQYLRDIIF